MRFFWIPVFALFVLFQSARAIAADVELAEPKPSIDNPRQVLVSLNFNDDKAVNNLLYNIVNIQKFYGQDNVEIMVLGWGPGVRQLLKPDTTVRARIESLTQYDIQFVACKNTMDTIGRKLDDLVDGVDWVQAGLPELIEREKNGWSIIWP